MQTRISSNSNRCSTSSLPSQLSGEQLLNPTRRRFLAQTALGVSCLGLSSLSVAQGNTNQDAIALAADFKQQQITPWFDANNRHLLSVDLADSREIRLHQHLGSFSASTQVLQLAPQVEQLLADSALATNPRLHASHQRFWLTFSSGGSQDSMQSYIAVADTVQGPYQLERIKPLRAANDVSLFTNQNKQMMVVATDGKMLAVAQFDVTSQRTGSWSAIALSEASTAQFISPVMTQTAATYSIACLQADNRIAHFQATDLQGKWQATYVHHRESIANDSQRLAFDPRQRLWSNVEPSFSTLASTSSAHIAVIAELA